MEKRGHILLVPYPSQGHINPMLEFSRRLASKGVKATLAITKFISNTLKPTSDGHVNLTTISDGYDEGGFAAAESINAYLTRLEASGTKSLEELIQDHAATTLPITCIVYDPFLPWALDVAEKHNLVGAAFFTQVCVVNYIFFLASHGKLTLPVSQSVEIPGLPPLDVGDLPSLVASPEYPAYIEMVLNQYSNLDKADFVLVNSYYALEEEVTDSMSREYPLLTIGPTIPSMYLDKQIEYDKDGLSLFHLDSETSYKTINWLSTKPPGSVVYVSFGSMASLSVEQMEELAWGLIASDCNFLWVVRVSEEHKLPKCFTKEIKEKGLLVRWSKQLEVLASKAIGCFFTHCGWNSTLEALAFGVPMIGMPQWTDQPTNAKLVQDVWKVGIRVKVNDKGIARREEIAACIMEVMVGEKREELVENAKKQKALAKKAACPGGSSDRNVEKFISHAISNSIKKVASTQ